MPIGDSWHRDLGSQNLSPWHDGSSNDRNRFVATIRGDLRFCELRHYLEFGLGGKLLCDRSSARPNSPSAYSFSFLKAVGMSSTCK